MNRYETIFIIRPDLEDNAKKTLLDKFKEVVEKSQGKVHVVEDWGKMRLCYEIKRQLKGIYTYFGIECEPAVLKEFERALRLNESVIKFQTIRVEGEFEPALIHPDRMDRMDKGRPGFDRGPRGMSPMGSYEGPMNDLEDVLEVDTDESSMGI